MQQQSGSRKRAAPGTSPMPQQQQQQQQQPPPMSQSGYQFNQGSPAIPDQFNNQFNADFVNPAFDPNLYASFGAGQPANLPTVASSPSNQLVRRNTNQQLMVGNQAQVQDQWLAPPNTGTAWEVNDSDQELDRKAAMAKRDAQAKRKQIPPFVLKLWSFLNDNKNTELIRWTDNGTAFTVLDEDEFARTLIPELFKHNNYASFVRQLNMYGFHKKVGLNANSMKAAEKKTKDPNVYWHEYFREGREDLLWLIQKPQSKTASAKRKRGQDTKDHGDSDGSRESPEVEGQVGIRNNAADVENLSKTEVSSVRSEIQKLQRQQSVISKIITQLKEQNEQFYRQASEFQSMHERHENSINAILTFLATFYNRSVGGSANLNNMFGNMQQPQQPQGTVVDMGDGDFAENAATNNNVNNNTTQQLQRFRRPQLLIEGSPARDVSMQPGNISSLPPSNRTSATASPPARDPRNNRISSLGAQSGASAPSARASTSPAIKDDVDTPPNVPHAYPETDDMMSYINAANANSPANPTGSPSFDFSRALNHAQTANGHSPLTPQQRNDMLNLIASQAGSSAATDNALTNPNPPPMPSLDQYARTQEQLEMLTRLQREQDSKVQDLAGRLQPLSPSGSIPGVDAYGGAGQMGHGAADATGGSDFDIDAFINGAEYFANFDGAGTETEGQEQGQAQGFADDDPTGLNFDFGNVDESDLFGGDGAGDGAGKEQGRVESVHSSPENEVGTGTGINGQDEETPSKRLRTG